MRLKISISSRLSNLLAYSCPQYCVGQKVHLDFSVMSYLNEHFGQSNIFLYSCIFLWYLLILFFHFFFLFFFWLCWVFIAVCGLSLVVASGSYSSLRYTGFSLQWLLLLQSMGSRCVVFSSCGMWAQQLWCMGSRMQSQQLWHAGLLVDLWYLPGPGIEPMSPALAGGFLTTVHQGSPSSFISDFIHLNFLSLFSFQ